jgi:transcriptional regulator with XRE-family HTH domain
VPKPKAKPDPKAWTPSQVVAHNLTRARELRRFTQTEVAERLSRFTGTRWTQATVAQAEGSVASERVRQFTANELVALARTFDLPVLYFFLPPEDASRALSVPDGPAKGWPWEYLLLLVWGHTENFPVVADRAAPFAHASAFITVPRDDALEGPNPAMVAGWEAKRQRLTPEDMLAVAFNGLARRRMRGAQRPGDELMTFAENLRGLADALEAFNNYRPGTFLSGQEVSDIAAERGHDGDGSDDPAASSKKD